MNISFATVVAVAIVDFTSLGEMFKRFMAQSRELIASAELWRRGIWRRVDVVA
jgi:hypothetical protein